MDSGIPAQRELRGQIPEARHRVADRVEPGPGGREWSDQHRGVEDRIVGRSLAAIDHLQADGGLAAENRGRERVRGRDHRQIFG